MTFRLDKRKRQETKSFNDQIVVSWAATSPIKCARGGV